MKINDKEISLENVKFNRNSLVLKLIRNSRIVDMWYTGKILLKKFLKITFSLNILISMFLGVLDNSVNYGKDFPGNLQVKISGKAFLEVCFKLHQ